MRTFLVVLVLLCFFIFPHKSSAQEDTNIDTPTNQEQATPAIDSILKDMHFPPVIVSILKVIPKPTTQTVLKTSSQVIGILKNAGLNKIDQKKYADARTEKFQEIEIELNSMINNLKSDFNIYQHSSRIKTSQNSFFQDLEEKNTAPQVAGESVSTENIESQKNNTPKNRSLWRRISETLFSTTVNSEKYAQ